MKTSSSEEITDDEEIIDELLSSSRMDWSAPTLVIFSVKDVTSSSIGPINDGFGGSTGS